ncbi:MAG: type I methionyl aminopeptidase [Clostridia bacterium]|nr:type I methionyl aminopeptidase [Clostridia bacterium]MDH7571951.1 type I methionyl aminopeptidase [Clostridia bacterium]
MIILKSDRELELMRQAGRVVAETLVLLERMVVPGVSTQELNEAAESYILKQGAYPSFKGYRGFPASICASVNEEVVHGLPGLRRLVEGDIISIDIGAELEGYHGDAAITVPVGRVKPEVERLLRVTQEALWLGIEQARPGRRLSDISHAIQMHVEKNGFSVVREFVGHGIGRTMHEEPQVPNYGRPGRGPRLTPGMTLAIEPMVNLGGPEVLVLADGWTVVTRDGSYSAHFEHTVAVTTEGPRVLTLP